ncbi:MAG: hypothetical protein P4L65_00310 [Legionella sp.]|nr:hypothetical protein [Legionella sp.]
MKKNKSYAQSPLGVMLVKLLQKITLLKEQYPDFPNVSDTIERKKAHQLLNATETLLKTLHEKAFPQFDNYNKPGLLSMFSILKSMYDLSVLKSEFSEDNLVITHPMTFEFVGLVIQLIENAPAELEQLIPFLNPEALVTDFHSGLTGSGVKKLFGSTYTTELAKNIDTPYTYILTTYSDQQVIKNTLSGAEYYSTSADDVKQGLLKPIQTYLIAAQNTPYVQSHCAKTAVLKRFTELELNALNAPFAKHKTACQQEPKLDQLEPLVFISTLTEEIKNNELLLKQNHQLAQALKKKIEYYATTSTGDLLCQHDVLRQELEEQTKQKIDTHYCLNPLPDQLVGFINQGSTQIGVIYVQKQLHEHIKMQIHVLLRLEVKLKEKLVQHKSLCQDMTGVWQKQTIAAHAAVTITQLAALERSEHSLGQVSKVPVEHDDEASLIDAVLKNKEVFSQLERISNDVTAQLEAIKKAAELSEHLQEQDTNKLIQTAQNAASQPIIERAQSLLTQIHQAQQEQHKEAHTLEARLAKIQSEAEFTRSMQSANPEELKRLLDDVGHQIEESETQQMKLGNDLITLSKQRTTQQEQLALFDEQVHHATTMITNNDAPYQELIQKLHAAAKEYAGLRNRPSTNDLIANYDSLVTFVSDVESGVEVSHQYKKNMGVFLLHANNLLNNAHKNAHIPFKQIDELLIPPQIKQQSTLKGFELLLAVLGLHNSIDWQDYRKRQDKAFKIKPKKSEYKAAFSLLNKGISGLLKESLLTEDILKIKTDLPQVKSELATHHQELSKWKQALGKATKERQDCLDLGMDLHQKQADTNQQVMLLSAKKEQLQINYNFLDNIIQIIARIELQQQRIQKLEENNAVSLSDGPLYTLIAELQMEHQQLLMTTQKAAEIAAQSDKASLYGANIQTLHKLLKSAQQRLTTTIKLKVDMEPLEQQLAELRYKLEEISAQHSNLPKKELITRFNECTLLLNDKISVIEQLGIKIHAINDQQTNQSFTALSLSLHTVQQKQSSVRDVLSEDLIHSLNHVKTKSQVFQARGLQELSELPERYSSQLQEAQQLLMTLPEEEQITPFTEQQRHEVRVLKGEITAQITQSQTANQALEARILQRTRLVDETLILNLNNYWAERKKRYSIKDALSPKDKSKRHKFIETLTEKLQEYAISGDSTQVLHLIEQKMPLFPGIKLHVILNKITSELMDLDHKIPDNYHEARPIEEDFDTKHARAIAQLEKHQQAHPDYVKAINNLYELIQKMHDSWPELTQKLRHDVDRLVLAHPQNIPDQIQYNQFKKQFTARLHSEDINDSQRSSWKLNLANIAVGILTLGIALGIKLIHSKIVEGRFKLFFEKTNNEEKERLAQAVQTNIAPPGA